MMIRRPTTQDLTWLLDLHRNKQLDLDPPYQRKSVWTRSDKLFFLDTIFRNYPSPAIFLHKTIDEAGKATYHVVDGKQRTQTILEFVDDKLRISPEFGDVTLNNKRWSELEGNQDLKKKLWNYQITVEMIDATDGAVVNNVFDRLNRNARRLTRQELRHAKFDGWFARLAENEATEVDTWRTFGIVTAGRSRRMSDIQFISELALVVLEADIRGFDQDDLDDMFGKYDDPAETIPEFNEDAFVERFSAAKNYLIEMNQHGGVVATHAKGFINFYTLWSYAVVTEHKPAAVDASRKYAEFMATVAEVGRAPAPAVGYVAAGYMDTLPGWALTYHTHTRGANTDLGPRRERLTALTKAMQA